MQRKKQNKNIRIIDWKAKNTALMIREYSLSKPNPILDDILANSEKIDNDILNVDNENKKNIISDQLEDSLFRVIVDGPLSSVKFSNHLFTNYLSKEDTIEIEEVSHIKNICNKIISLAELPIDYDLEPDYLVNEKTNSDKSERYVAVHDYYENKCQSKLYRNYNGLLKYNYLDLQLKRPSKHRIIGFLNWDKQEFYICFLDPHHLLATSVEKQDYDEFYENKDLDILNIL